jgi:Mrp family chromosome partitioning ATPase
MSRILDRLKQAQTARGEVATDAAAQTAVPSPFVSDRSAPAAIETRLPDPVTWTREPPVPQGIDDEAAQLFARLRPLLEQRRSLILHVTAASPGEGTSTVAQALARHAAATGRYRTLLIDANPAHAKRLNGGPTIGLVESHRARTEVAASVSMVEADRLGTVSLASAGSYHAGLPEYAEIERIYNALRSQWPVIVVDAAPALGSVDILNIAALSDGVLLVVEAERSRHMVVKRAKEQLESTGAHILGVVLNRRRLHIPALLYGMV